MTSGPKKSLERELPETLQAELERSGKGGSWRVYQPHRFLACDCLSFALHSGQV